MYDVSKNLRELISLKVLILALTTPLVITSGLAQIDTTLRDFFPLHVGNLWEYELDDYPSYPRYQVRNVGDTLMPNGRVYFHLQGPAHAGGYFRIDDSLRVFRYSPEYPSCTRGEFLIYDLRLSDGELWSTCLPFFGSGSPIISFIGLFFTDTLSYPYLGVSALTKYFSEVQVDTVSGDTIFDPLALRIPYLPRRLARGFGFVWSQYEGPGINLVGAIINGIRYGHITGIENQPQHSIPRKPTLRQNYPNPFNPATRIKYGLPFDSYVSIRVFDVLGRVVATLADQNQRAGWYEVNFDASGFPSGVYFYRMTAGNFTLTRKLLLMK